MFKLWREELYAKAHQESEDPRRHRWSSDGGRSGLGCSSRRNAKALLPIVRYVQPHGGSQAVQAEVAITGEACDVEPR